jgi:antitoxin MazE
MKATLRKMGNSQGVLIPKALIAQLGIEGELDMTLENDAIVLRKPAEAARAGWAEASREVAASGGDKLVWPEFANAGDADLEW